MNISDKEIIEKAVAQHKDEAISLLQKLIRIPSVNHPPTGDEKEIQEFYFNYLGSLGLEAEIFEPLDVPGFKEHPGRLKDHDMNDRPNVVGKLKGKGTGKSIMLVAHADTELPGADYLWTDNDPFSGTLRHGKIFGRGAGDDKSGMAINAVIPKILKYAGIQLNGDLIIASVSDEEQAGSNGAVALVCKGYKADACLNVDGCDLELWISNLGGGFCNIEITVPAPQSDASALIGFFNALCEKIMLFNKIRGKDFESHPHYMNDSYKRDTVRLMNISLGVDDATHGRCTVWFYILPGEDPSQLRKQFEDHLQGIKTDGRYDVQWMSRFVLASEVDEDHPFVNCLRESFILGTGHSAAITGSPMSDQGFLNEYGGFPCINMGPSRGKGKTGTVHQPDEYVEVETFMEGLKIAVFSVMNWCGYIKK